MKWFVGVGLLVLVALGCSSSSTNPGAGGSAGSSGNAGSGGSAGSGASEACAKTCLNKHSDQVLAFNLGVEGCNVSCCADCSCGDATTPDSKCLSCIKGNTCLSKACLADGCGDLTACLTGCGAF